MILGISGRKQSGKDSVAKLIQAETMKRIGIIEDYKFGDYTGGKLFVPVALDDGTITEYELNFERVDVGFAVTMDKVLWDHVRQYGFADSLKDACVYLWGLKEEQVYGSDAEKNSLTQYDWSKFVPKKKGAMTAREFLQEFAKTVRRIDDNRFISNTLAAIEARSPKVAIIKDVRFKNEVTHIKEKGGVVIRMTRKIDDDTDISETELDSYSGFDLTVDNQNMTLDEQNKLILEWADDRNLLPK